MVYLSIGSNLGDRLLHLQLAVGMIAYRIGEIKSLSKVVETPAWGFEGEAFYNACLAVDTPLRPEEVLTQLLEIEEFLGRKRSEKNGYQSRTIDLDIVFYGDRVLKTDRLTLPHPRMQERNFVLAPLAEIAPAVEHPESKLTVESLLKTSEDTTAVTEISAPLFPVKKVDYIAIEGNIGVGKTTFAERLQAAIGGRLLLENFYDNPYLEDFYRDPETFALPVENAFLEDRIQQQNQFFSRTEKGPVIADYCLEKSPLFARQNLNEKDIDLYLQSYTKKVASLPQPAIVFFLEQSIEQLLKNIEKRGRSFEQNMETAYLKKIEQGYQAWQNESQLKQINFPLMGGDITKDPSVFYRFLMALFRL